MTEMTCTRCFRPAGDMPAYDNLPVDILIKVCAGWLCADCLDEDEDALADDQSWDAHKDEH